MRLNYVVIFLSFFILVACSNMDSNNLNSNNLTSIEGIIADKPANNIQILVIPNIDKSDITNKNINDLLSLAEDKGGIYFIVSGSDYNKYNVGDKVSVKYDPQGDVEESNPPIREAINVKSIN